MRKYTKTIYVSLIQTKIFSPEAYLLYGYNKLKFYCTINIMNNKYKTETRNNIH